MRIVIEEMASSRKITTYHRFDTNAITIGRGLDNDIIAHDNYVDITHLRIAKSDNGWQIKDLASTNGVYVNKKSIAQAKLKPIRSGDIITIGQSRFRFLLPEHPISPTTKLSNIEPIIKTFTRLPVFFLMVGFALAWAFYAYFHSMPIALSLNMSALYLFKILLIGFIWPIIYSFVALLGKGETRFFAQLSVAFFLFPLLWMLYYANAYIVFNIQNHFIYHLVDEIPDYIALFVILITSSFICFQQSIKKRLFINGAIVALIFFGQQFMHYTADKDIYITRAGYHPLFKHKDFLVRAPSSVDDFMQDSLRIFDIPETDPHSQD